VSGETHRVGVMLLEGILDAREHGLNLIHLADVCVCVRALLHSSPHQLKSQSIVVVQLLMRAGGPIRVNS
jgi:hypothetical protein